MIIYHNIGAGEITMEHCTVLYCTVLTTHYYTTRTYRLEPPLQYHCCHLIDVLELLRTRDVLRPIHEEGLQGQGFGL